MGALLQSANSDRLTMLQGGTNVTPAFSISFWFKIYTTGVAQTIWSQCNAGFATQYRLIRVTAGNVLQFTASDAGGEVNATLATTISANTWVFVMARAVTDTNRRITALYPDGSIETATNATSRIPSSPTERNIGCRGGTNDDEFLDGVVAEYALYNADVYFDTASNPGIAEMLQYAYVGPFSRMNRARDNIIEYMSFRNFGGGGPGADTSGGASDNIGEVYRQTRLSDSYFFGTASPGEHPPLPYDYQHPEDFTRIILG